MSLNLDAAAEDLDELLPFQLFREFTEVPPSSCQGLFAVNILSFFDLSRLVVTITVGEQEQEHQQKGRTLDGRPKWYPFAFRNISFLCTAISGDTELRSLVYLPGFSPEDEAGWLRVRDTIDHTYRTRA